jgi:hypothetical protein
VEVEIADLTRGLVKSGEGSHGTQAPARSTEVDHLQAFEAQLAQEVASGNEVGSKLAEALEEYRLAMANMQSEALPESAKVAEGSEAGELGNAGPAGPVLAGQVVRALGLAGLQEDLAMGCWGPLGVVGLQVPARRLRWQAQGWTRWGPRIGPPGQILIHIDMFVCCWRVWDSTSQSLLVRLGKKCVHIYTVFCACLKFCIFGLCLEESALMLCVYMDQALMCAWRNVLILRFTGLMIRCS